MRKVEGSLYIILPGPLGFQDRPCQTAVCNSPEFNRAVVNHDLHYSIWDASSKNEPRLLSMADAENKTKRVQLLGLDFRGMIRYLIALMMEFYTAYLES
jgi:hypothetical protein